MAGFWHKVLTTMKTTILPVVFAFVLFMRIRIRMSLFLQVSSRQTTFLCKDNQYNTEISLKSH
jgi:hypothetical protein